MTRIFYATVGVFTQLYLLTFAQKRCTSAEFQCSFTGNCIPKEVVCDGMRDCGDGSDETTDICRFRPCNRNIDFLGSELLYSDNFRCKYGACISSSFVCDGVTHCVDRSDEAEELCSSRSCAANKFRCNYGACITASYRCNGKVNCHDGSDETRQLCLNPRKPCRSREFQCDYGACIYEKKKCNGRADCADESDESLSLCGENHVFKSIKPSTAKQITNSGSPPELRSPSGTINTAPEPPKQLNVEELVTKLISAGIQNNEHLINTIINVVGTKTDGERPAIPVPFPGTTTKPNTPPSFITERPVLFPTETPAVTPCGENLCRCPEPNELLCLPCQEDQESLKALCLKVGDENVCSIPVASFNVTFSVLSCGVDYTVFISSFHRTQSDCGKDGGVPVLSTVAAKCLGQPTVQLTCQPDGLWHSIDKKIKRAQLCQPPQQDTGGAANICSVKTEDMNSVSILSCGTANTIECGGGGRVPVFTTVLAECWRTTSMLLTCQPDGHWYPYDEKDRNKKMEHICQPSQLDSEICGLFPFFTRKTAVAGAAKSYYKWPFLIGIFNSEDQFICTGTLISSQWVITAAHCVSSQTGNVIDAASFRIQHSLSEGVNNLAKLRALYVHPSFTVTPQLMSDLALLQLEEPLLFSDILFPACLDRDETLFGQNAATFIRKEGENQFRWSLKSQIIDTACFNRESPCTRHLVVGDNQFCSKRSEDDENPEPGSSGGPYLINKGTYSDEKWSVAGIVSYEFGTEICPAYTVFSSVSLHRAWIDNCVERGRCS